MLIARRTLLMSGLSALAAPRITRASTPLVVEMLNKHPDDRKLRMIFMPRLAVVDPGDTILFQATDKGHNSASADGMIPDGAEPWEGKLGKDIEVTFDQPGIYGYVCTPHIAGGMVGAVVVQGPGALDNLEAVKSVKQRGKAKKIFAEIWEEIESLDLTT